MMKLGLMKDICESENDNKMIYLFISVLTTLV